MRAGVTGVQIDVVADDRTGALETAAAIADRLEAPVPVAVWPDAAPVRSTASVVDLASRHLPAAEAAARAATLAPARRSAHKIDSTLRGNWAAELVARHRACGQPVLVVPALPDLGRTCVGGVVLVDGVPVHETAVAGDARGGVVTSRPAELLSAAATGSLNVVEIGDLADLSGWLRAGAGVAVVDAADAETIGRIVDRWHQFEGVLLAGTSGVIGAAVGRPRTLMPMSRTDAIGRPILVVCGSANPAARAQIDHAVACGAVATERIDVRVVARMQRGAPVILCPPVIAGPVSHEAAAAMAARLVAEASAVIESGIVGTLVVIGGDTAAAILGDALVVVHGSLAPGTALVESLVCDVPIVTRAGGFGAANALSDLLWDTLAS